MVSSIDWNAIWSSGSSSSTPGMVRAGVGAIGVLRIARLGARRVTA
jgi:hypothetical protein